MSEIERAIECFNNKVWSGELFESEVDMYNAVIGVLRAELEREKNPLTWNERINQMTAEEKVLLFDSIISCMDCPAKTEWCNGSGRCNEALTLLMHSPYTEGETK